MMKAIRDRTDLEAGLEALLQIDPRLEKVLATAREVPLRLSPPGFPSLVSIIISQQVSKASAAAINERLFQLLQPVSAEAILTADETVFRRAGLSRPKQATLIALAQHVSESGLDLEELCTVEPDLAMSALIAIRGIGPWTAEVYLLFCAGHPDIFPARDIALQAAVQNAFGLEERPGEKALTDLARAWEPWRGVAARLFWSYYREMKGRDVVPV